jgi:hypothetical protein
MVKCLQFDRNPQRGYICNNFRQAKPSYIPPITILSLPQTSLGAPSSPQRQYSTQGRLSASTLPPAMDPAPPTHPQPQLPLHVSSPPCPAYPLRPSLNQSQSFEDNDLSAYVQFERTTRCNLEPIKLQQPNHDAS